MLHIIGHFNLLWAVFRAHSTAEDDVIWPALKAKGRNCSCSDDMVEEGEYEDDHAQEANMFQEMDRLLGELRETEGICDNGEWLRVVGELASLTVRLVKHLNAHLDKEETNALPVIKQTLSHSEIEELVGEIMGKRSTDMMTKFLQIMVRNLPPLDQRTVMRHLQHVTEDTFFAKWLEKGGFSFPTGEADSPRASPTQGAAASASDRKRRAGSVSARNGCQCDPDTCAACTFAASLNESDAPRDGCLVCSQIGTCPSLLRAAEGKERFEKGVRSLARHPSLGGTQRAKLLQLVHSACWEQTARKRPRSASVEQAEGGQDGAMRKKAAVITEKQPRLGPVGALAVPPMRYLVRNSAGEIMNGPSDQRFTMEEVGVSRHPSGELGCPHYKRKVKLRAPCCGKLFTCRLCHDQASDHIMDRFEVSEMLCMVCGTLQPVGDRCIAPGCAQSSGVKPISNYYCNICHLFDDDEKKDIYHCPYCNVCRAGKGLGIDYRHCMRCNACVRMDKPHKCLSKVLQGRCPCCLEDVFSTRQSIKALRCGHVMHMKCYQQYRQHSYTCPICWKSVDDMSEYYAHLDLYMSNMPMPAEYAGYKSLTYCNDCEQKSWTQWHFAHTKCPSCASYNTRVLEKLAPEEYARRMQAEQASAESGAAK